MNQIMRVSIVALLLLLGLQTKGVAEPKETIKLSKPQVTSRTPEETMLLIKKRVQERVLGLKCIDKIVFITSGDTKKLVIPSRTMQEFSVLQFKKSFASSGVGYWPAMSLNERAAFEKTATDPSALVHGFIVFDFSYMVQKDADVVAYYLKMTLCNYDAATDYMASWDQPSVWESEYLGTTTKKELVDETKKSVTALMERAAADLQKSKTKKILMLSR